MADEVVQKQATVEQIIKDHINGVGGYEIAEKYGMDTEKVKQILNEANDAGKFIPEGADVPVDHQGTSGGGETYTPSKLNEGENPEATQATTNTKKK